MNGFWTELPNPSQAPQVTGPVIPVELLLRSEFRFISHKTELITPASWICSEACTWKSLNILSGVAQSTWGHVDATGDVMVI